MENKYYNIKVEKNALRALFAQKRQAILPEEKKTLDAKICKNFLSLASYRYADTIMLFFPKSDEPDTVPIIERALSDGKKVALPRCREHSQMDFFVIRSLDDLEAGKFGIPAPREYCELVDPNDRRRFGNTVIAVPGIVFDKSGHRIGYGKGFYDRYISAYKGNTVGICYSFLLKDTIPHGKYDTPVNALVTDKGVLAT